MVMLSTVTMSAGADSSPGHSRSEQRTSNFLPWEAAYAEGSLCFGRKFVGWLERDTEQACTPAIPEFFAGGSFAEACG